MTAIAMPEAVAADIPITLKSGEPLLLGGAPATLSRIRRCAQLKHPWNLALEDAEIGAVDGNPALFLAWETKEPIRRVQDHIITLREHLNDPEALAGLTLHDYLLTVDHRPETGCRIAVRISLTP